MKAFEVRNLKWENFPKEEIAKILPTFKASKCGLCICYDDVIKFVKNHFAELDERIGTQRSTVYILEEENVCFFEKVYDFFCHRQAVKKDDERFVSIMTSLRLPIISDDESAKLQMAVNCYTQLTDSEKEKFFEVVGTKPE